MLTSVAQLGECPTGDQEYVGLTSAGRQHSFVKIMKYFLMSFADSRRAVVSVW